MSGATDKGTIDAAALRRHWKSGVTELQPGVVRLRGYPIEQVIGGLDFASTTWLMLRGELPTPAQARLLEAALVASVDHGPLSPSAATAHMAATCGIGINGVLSASIALLGDHHGGAGQQCMEMFLALAARIDGDADVERVVAGEFDRREAVGEKFVAGYGKHLHPVDPRAARLMELMREARAEGVIEGRFAHIAQAIEDELKRRKGRLIPLNIDGATAVVLAELGFTPPHARGLFILGRMVGLMAHALEEMQRGTRNKSPIPPGVLFDYDGPPARDLPSEGRDGA